jgi:hypothetical protein
MGTKEISAVVLVYNDELIVMTEPDKLRANHAPFRIVGALTYVDGQVRVTPVAGDRDGNMVILGAAMTCFLAHVERVKKDAALAADAVTWLERLYEL